MRSTRLIRWRRDEAMGEEGRRCVRCGREDVDEDRFDCSGGRGVSTFHGAGSDYNGTSLWVGSNKQVLTMTPL
jgi:hypothetical protein